MTTNSISYVLHNDINSNEELVFCKFSDALAYAASDAGKKATYRILSRYTDTFGKVYTYYLGCSEYGNIRIAKGHTNGS